MLAASLSRHKKEATEYTNPLSGAISDFQSFSLPESDDFKTQKARELYDWYQGFLPDHPRRQDFDIIKHWGLSPYIYLVNIRDDGSFHYQLYGDQVIEILAQSQKGSAVDRNQALSGNKIFIDYLHQIIETKASARSIGNLSLFGRSHMEFESFDCPLQNAAGHISYILGVISFVQ